MNISVIMTVKNGEKFLARSLGSVLGQVYKPKEIVIVDDGSTDGTARILDEYCQKYNMIKRIETSGVGRAKALNMAWKNAIGDWIANIDVDDWWHSFKLAEQVRCVEKYSECKFVTTESYIVQSAFFSFPESDKNSLPYDFSRIKKESLYSKNPINHSSVMIQKGLLQALGGYNPELKRQIDYDLWIRILESGELMYKVNSKLSVKYVHEEQSFESTNRLRYLTHALKMNYMGLFKLGAPFWFYQRPLISFLFGMLPRGARSRIKKFFK